MMNAKNPRRIRIRLGFFFSGVGDASYLVDVAGTFMSTSISCFFFPLSMPL